MRQLLNNNARASSDIDVVLFDERGSKWLNKCIPQGTSTVVVSSKVSLGNLYRFPILFSMLKWFFLGQYEKLGMRGRLVCAYFLALIEKINPIVVISNNDGSEIIRAIGLNHKRIFVAVVQLALRERYQNTKISTLPTYFSFGRAQEKLFSESGITCDDLRPVGSLRNSIYRDNSLGEIYEPTEGHTLVFISQWKRGLCLNPTISLHRAWNKGHRRTFQAVYRYARDHSIELKVVLRNTFDHSDNMEQQERYFIEAARSSEINFFSSRDDELASYPPAYSGDVAVHFLSTLGFEVFGHGGKVLCCVGLGGGKEFIEEFGVQELIEELPQEVLLWENDEERISEMITNLIDMSRKNYESLTKKARNYYMTVEEVEKTHERIQSDIVKILNANTDA